MPPRRRTEPVEPDDRPELSVEAAVGSVLADAPMISPAHDALVAIALTLARKLDDGAGMATAAVASELRQTLDDLLKEADDGDDDGLSGFLAGLSAPVGDKAQP